MEGIAECAGQCLTHAFTSPRVCYGTMAQCTAGIAAQSNWMSVTGHYPLLQDAKPARGYYNTPDDCEAFWHTREEFEGDLVPMPQDHQEAARHADELLAEVEAEKRAKGKKGKKKKKGGGAGGAGPSQETEEGAEAPSEAATAEAAKKAEEERMIRLLEKCHEERIRLGITAESQAAASAEVARAEARAARAEARAALRRADLALEGSETALEEAAAAAEARGAAAAASMARAVAARMAADAAQERP
ncbi:hypothetical protein EMIHUDRAFT_232228 [Emiliania huxleyi CCMP1516]|uniref:Uncharacterized protein n=2 Tax=Emiliania huxleyi TaxID=2903 RepID=A0A0D3K680_EMIH1|nr:hypothetical protein EMIHUDRAFT_232228 [Emiliania huxleyi CCMP1516]EOD31265.1 hypothetical protein EMIHUDRAFT_232228 [Emiliania huxleyi CCMP1516]|eukprot:XP_005783694.1 hypothetical protein EMIHUDRAFT_232228 [Emiliania huxleyi CCMP1516]